MEDRRLLSLADADGGGLPFGPHSLDAGVSSFAPGEILIGFEGEVAAAYHGRGVVEALAAAESRVRGLGLHGAKVLMEVPATQGRAARLATQWQLPLGGDVAGIARQLSGQEGIAYAEPNYIWTADAVPNDPRFGELWGMNNTGQTGGTADADIDAPEAWGIATGDSRIIVGVIDTGVDYNHPDLAANIWTNPGETPGDGIDNDGNGYVDDLHGWDFVNNDGDPWDDNGHGTHTSGTIAAVGNNGVGVAGVNWQGQIMALKFLDAGGSGSTANAVAAVQYATKMRSQFGVNVRLTSNSWGGGAYSQALYDAIEASGASGMLFVASAGNSNADNNVSPAYPASYNLDNIISVAATDASDVKASFSSYGSTTVDLAAPGVGILSTTPNNTYSVYDGTSMAAPHVSGVAALAWGVAPSVSAATIKAAVLTGADPITSMTGMTVTGGRLNAFRTLQQVGMTVRSSSPAEGGIVTGPPQDFVVQFSFPVLAGTLAETDLIVNTRPANEVALSGDRLQATFHYNASPVAVEGLQIMEMAAGAVQTDSSTPFSKGLVAWQAQFRYDALRMQPAAYPADGSTLALPWNTFTVTLNEDVAGTSVASDDLVLSQGTVVTAEPLGLRTVQYTLAGLDEGDLTIVLPAGALTDSAGNPSLPLQTTFHLDFGTVAYPGTFVPVEPLGSLVYDSQITGSIGLIGSTDGTDTDVFQIDLDAGQTITVIAEWMPTGFSWRTAESGGIHGYRLTSSRFDWHEAQAEAASIGGYLASINTAAEQQFLEENFLTGTGATTTFWLGLSDEVQEGVWNPWSSGEPVTYTNWQPGEPNDNGGNEDYGAINWHAATGGGPVGTWNDLPVAGYGDGPYQGIIEVPDYVPEVPFLPSVSVQDQLGGQLGSALGSVPGEEVILQTLPATAPGTYTVTIGSATAVSGNYRLRVLLNTAVENEEHGGPTNDDLVSAQPIDASFVPLPDGTASRAAVLGLTRGIQPVAGPVRTYAKTASLAIPDPGTVTSTLTVADSYLIDDVNVRLDITHNYDADLDVFLIAPDGTRIELFTDVGGSANHFTGTILDDEATTAITAGSAPFTGVFRPEGRLSALDTHNVQGIWTLEVTDDAKRDRGTLNSWSLEVSEVVDAPDYYSFHLDAEQTATLALNVPNASAVDLELWGPDGVGGNVLQATGAGGRSNVDQAIAAFVAPRAGTYYARVDGAGRGWDYSLVVLRGATFDLEANDSPAAAQNLTGGPTVLLGGIDTAILPGAGVIESFDDGGLSEYQWVSGGASVTSQAAHDGGYGLSIDAEWIVRDDEAVRVARGQSVSAWVRFPGSAAGRAYFGFGASTSATLSLTLAPNSGQFLFQRVSSGYEDLASAPQAWVADRWYRVEVEWQSDGDLVGRLYDSDGLTLLNAITAHDDAIASGGLAFRGFSGAKFFDTIQVNVPSPDFFRLEAGVGDRIDLSAATPLGGPGLPANDLAPALRLYNAAGKLVAQDEAVAGGNALLSYIVPPGAARDYFVEVRSSDAAATSGQYLVTWSKTLVTDAVLFVSDATVIEGDADSAAAVFSVTLLNAPSVGTVDVTYKTENGSALAPHDYAARSDTVLSLSAADPTRQISVAVFGDAFEEDDEVFSLVLSNPTAGAKLANGERGVGTIRNDDAAASVSDVRVLEGDSGTVDATFTVSLSRPSASQITIGYGTANGTATLADGDYQAAAGSLVFEPGQTSGSIVVRVQGDRTLEPEETFFVDLTNPQNKPGLTFAKAQGIGTIYDQESAIPVAPPAGLLSWWTGDGNALDLVGPNEATLYGGAGYATGEVAQAFDFNGDSYAVAGTAGLPTGNQDRTLELWAKIDTQVSQEAFFASYGVFGNNAQVYSLGTSNGTVFFSTWGPAIFGPQLQNGRWYHVAATNQGNMAKLYLDGVLVASGAMEINTPASQSVFRLGRQFPNDPNDIRRLDGQVDEVSVYNRSLSGDELLSIYRAGAAGKGKGPGITVLPTSGLVTTEAGGSDSFGVVLNAPPTQDVTIAVASSDTTEATVSPAALTFTPLNWNIPQTVNVVGRDDLLADGNIAYSIRLAPASSTDPSYNGIDAPDVSATNLDNETVTVTYSSADVPKTIPDRTKITSTLTISDTFTIADLNVGLSINHTRDEDLDVFLIAPDGTRVELFTDVGGTGDNFTNTVLDHDAATSITSGTAPFSATFQPEGDLTALKGDSIAGTWTLEITDDYRKETGTLLSWSLIVTSATSGSQALASASTVAPQNPVRSGGLSAGDLASSHVRETPAARPRAAARPSPAARAVDHLLAIAPIGRLAGPAASTSRVAKAAVRSAVRAATNFRAVDRLLAAGNLDLSALSALADEFQTLARR